ncbi:MAG: sensor histidine kinase, partial [Stackebrandtia sp.]
PRPVDVDLSELVREEIARRAAADRIPVRVTVAEDVTIAAVRTHVTRVLTNLLDNAQRHARDEVTVELAAEPGGGARLSVGDDGPGIPQAERERVFDRFVRLDEARSRDAGGAGMGLAIVREVVTAHGGRIRVDTAPAGGTLIVVVLPGRLNTR